MNDLPEILTEEEAERKAAMIKSAREVAEAANEMKVQLERLGWNIAEQAALTLFNTLLMTAFSEQMKNAGDKAEQRQKEFRERFLARAVELARQRGFTGDDVTKTCLQMLMDGKPEQQAIAVWEDFYGEGSGGVLFAIIKKTETEVKPDDEEKD